MNSRGKLDAFLNSYKENLHSVLLHYSSQEKSHSFGNQLDSLCIFQTLKKKKVEKKKKETDYYVCCFTLY